MDNTRVSAVTMEDTGSIFALPKVRLIFEDESVFSFDFFPDEITYTEAELMGKTKSEIDSLRNAKEIAYLLS